MSIIYIISDYGRLMKKGDVLQLKKGDDILKTIFPFKTEQLLIIGRIEITSAAINLLMRHRINTVFLHRNGRFNGRLTFPQGKNVFLRRRQFQSLEDERFVLAFVKAIVRGKLRNQLTFMQRTLRTKELGSEGKKAISGLKQILISLEKADNLKSIRGFEGIGARYYFSVFRRAIKPSWAVFNGRSMNPPQDNVNAVLSFLYTLLFYRVDAALETVGLDPYVGYLHVLNYGKPALAFDLLEEYRTPLADTLTVALFNLGILTADDFEPVTGDDVEYPLESEDSLSEENISPVKKGVLLSKDGLKKVIPQLEKKLDTLFFHQELGARLTYKKLFFEQARHFRRVLSGEEMAYRPLQIK